MVFLVADPSTGDLARRHGPTRPSDESGRSLTKQARSSTPPTVPVLAARPAGARSLPALRVRPYQIGFEVDLDGEQVGDVDRPHAKMVLGDRSLDAALEVVPVIALLQMLDEHILVA